MCVCTLRLECSKCVFVHLDWSAVSVCVCVCVCVGGGGVGGRGRGVCVCVLRSLSCCSRLCKALATLKDWRFRNSRH